MWTVSKPAPLLRQALADRRAAPIFPWLPAIRSAWPNVPLWAKRLRGWKTAAISSSVTNVNCVGVLAIISGCNRMSSTFHSPTNSAFSGSRNANFGKPNVSVRSAWIIASGSFLRLSSPNRPEGMSIATTVASDWLIYLTIAANPPVKGRFRPEPNKPSITTSRSSSSGGTKSSTTSVNSIFSM